MRTKRVHAIIAGKVQGVFFRVYTRDEAIGMGLSGWVRNRPDGTVETEIEGEASDVDRMLNWLKQGSPHSRVDDVIIYFCTPLNIETDFSIQY